MYVSRYGLVVVFFLNHLVMVGQNDQQGRIANYLQQQESSHAFSGSVLIAKGDKTLFEGAYGYSDRSADLKNQIDTRYSLASLGKLFTMIAILKLVEEERIALDDRLTQYVKGFTDERASQITIRQLLRHRAGWHHYWNHPEYVKYRFETDSIKDYMRFIKKMPLGFDPGRRSQYSNIGYVVLGAVIEKVTGQDYYDYIEKSIFKPLGMGRSDYAAYRSLGTEYARHGGDAAKKDMLNMTAVRGTADGGGYSTIKDLCRLSQVLFNRKLLNEKSVALIVNGFQTDRLGDNWQVRIAGGFPGISTVLGYHSEDDLTVIILSNSVRFSAPNLMDDLVRIIRN